MRQPHEILISADGTIRVVYSDDLAPMLSSLGKATIRRASHVEPDGDGQWWADMAPVGGSRLGPFALRADALAAEVKWLLDHDTPAPNAAKTKGA